MKRGLARRREKAITTSHAPTLGVSVSPDKVEDPDRFRTRWYGCCKLGCCELPCPSESIGHIVACSHQREQATA